MDDSSDAGRSFDDVNDALYKRGETDGLPVVPPTVDRVDEMLAGSHLPRDEIVGRLGNKDEPLTVETLAANAVMAGCRPVHMPVLIAGAEALADPDSRSIGFSVSTASFGYFWIVNGPVADDLDVRSGSGAFGPGFRANGTIGRALGLAYKNTTRIHPGEKDMSTLGNPFKYSLIAAENEARSPFEPYHVTNAGFGEDDSTITLAGPNSLIGWSPYEYTAEDVLKGMVYQVAPTMFGKTYPDHASTIHYVLSPANAEVLAEAGLTKRDVKEYVVENSYRPRETYAWGATKDSAVDRREDGTVPPLQFRQLDDPESVKVVVVGGPGRANATIGRSVGGPVTKEITLPDDWDELLEAHTVEREWDRTSRFYG